MSVHERLEICSSEPNEKQCILRNPNSKFHNLITNGEVEDFVKKYVSKDAKLIDYHCRSYSEEKLGYLGSYFSLRIVIQNPQRNDNDTIKLFVKSMPLDVPSQLTSMTEKGYFNKEVEYFRTLEPPLTKNFKGESWSPKSYQAKESALIFEDLSTKGFFNRNKLLDKQSVKAALSCLARFHAASLLAEERNNGRSLKDLFPDMLKEPEFNRTDQRFYTQFTVAMDLAVTIANNLGLDSTRVREAGERAFDISKLSKTKRNVVSHGDLWSNNVMFNNEDHCRIIDFQMIRYSPLAQDIMLFLYMSTTREFRQKFERESIESYYKALIETLRNNSFKGQVPTFDEILQGAEEQKLPTLAVTTMYNPAQMMDGKAGIVLNDSLNYENYFFKDRRPFVLKHMLENEVYAKKLEDNVRELVEMSMIIDTLPSVS